MAQEANKRRLIKYLKEAQKHCLLQNGLPYCKNCG